MLTTEMSTSDLNAVKAQEARLRRAARRNGFALTKSRRRSRYAEDRGYMLIDATANAVVLGGYSVEFSASLADIEDYLAI